MIGCWLDPLFWVLVAMSGPSAAPRLYLEIVSATTSPIMTSTQIGWLLTILDQLFPDSKYSLPGLPSW
jgi:hypothetical protein